MGNDPVRSKIAVKGRLVIPKALRQRAGLREGDHVQLEFRGGEIIIMKEPSSAIDSIRGVLEHVWATEESSVKIQRRLRKEWRAR